MSGSIIFSGARPLQGQLGVLGADVFNLHRRARLGLALDPMKVFIRVRRVDANKKYCCRQAIKNDVVDDTAVFVEQQVILRLKGLHTRNVIGADALAQIESSLAADFDLAHVAHIE